MDPSAAGQGQPAASAARHSDSFASAAVTVLAAHHAHEQQPAAQQPAQQPCQQPRDQPGQPHALEQPHQVAHPHIWHSGQAKRRWQLAAADTITHNTQVHHSISLPCHIVL